MTAALNGYLGQGLVLGIRILNRCTYPHAAFDYSSLAKVLEFKPRLFVRFHCRSTALYSDTIPIRLLLHRNIRHQWGIHWACAHELSSSTSTVWCCSQVPRLAEASKCANGKPQGYPLIQSAGYSPGPCLSGNDRPTHNVLALRERSCLFRLQEGTDHDISVAQQRLLNSGFKIKEEPRKEGNNALGERLGTWIYLKYTESLATQICCALSIGDTHSVLYRHYAAMDCLFLKSQSWNTLP